MIFIRTVVISLFAACVCVSPVAGWAKDKETKPKVSVLLKDANEFMSQAQTAYVDGHSKQAIELYRKALAEIARVERENEKQVATSEFAPVRFRKALCETEIDRIMLEDVSANARSVAVTDTTALEAKRAERKKAAETNNLPEASVNLSSKQGVRKESADKPEPKGEKTPDPEEPGKPLNVKAELEWAKDMISVNRFDDAEKALMAVLKQFPDRRDARFLMALSRVQQGHHEDAAVVIEGLLADSPNDEPALLLAAGIYAAVGHYSKAMDTLDKAMKADPKRPEGYLNMAWLLLEMNTKGSGEAEMYYRQSVKLGGPRDRDIERRLGIKSE